MLVGLNLFCFVYFVAKAQFTWENLIFALVWMNMQIHSLPLGAALEC